MSSSVDAANAAFWDELCGSGLARQLGITDASQDSLRRFDAAYFDLYPYLSKYLNPIASRKGRTLEIGLGYGTVSGYLASTGVDYHGLDIASGPVEMVRERLRQLGQAERAGQVLQGSALAIPWPDGHFDSVVSIGCLHHTGDLADAIREVRRVLSDGGTAMVMVYNRNSLRQLVHVRPSALLRKLRGHAGDSDARRAYDANAAGEAAPFTEFVSARGVKQLFSGYTDVRVARENMDPLPRFGIARERMLGRPARVLGLDLYVTAVK